MEEPADRFERRIAKAKRLIFPRRSSEDWQREAYASSPLIKDLLGRVADDVPRVDGREASCVQFIAEWEAPRRPVVVAGLTDEWPARERWSLPRLLREYGGERFKMGEDDDSYAVFLKLKYYLRYLATNRDDSPLYIFDSSFAERQGTRELRHDYSLPPYFADDLFKLVGERRRPPYRWLVLGPARSGSYVHIDPLGTSAWNALLHGRKLWALFPPFVPKEVVQPKGCGGREAIAWWARVYPRLCEAEDPTHRPLTIVQRAGETVFVPGGWWHCVLNLETTVAVTQNFCSRTNFDAVWLKTRKSRPKMSRRLVEQLQHLEPELYQRTIALADVCLETAAGSSSTSSSSSSSSSSDADSDSEGGSARPARRDRSVSPSGYASGGERPNGGERFKGDEQAKGGERANLGERAKGGEQADAVERAPGRSRSPRRDGKGELLVGGGRASSEERCWREAARGRHEHPGGAPPSDVPRPSAGPVRAPPIATAPGGKHSRAAGEEECLEQPQPKRVPTTIAPLVASPSSDLRHERDDNSGREGVCQPEHALQLCGAVSVRAVLRDETKNRGK